MTIVSAGRRSSKRHQQRGAAGKSAHVRVHLSDQSWKRGSCRTYSVPLLDNNVIWQNRSFFIGVGGLGAGNQNQQKVVTLYNSLHHDASSSQSDRRLPGSELLGNRRARRQWTDEPRGGRSLAPAFSVLSDAGDYPGANNSWAIRRVSQYCNGSRVPPELGSMGYTVNPGTNETNALPTPVFSLTPSATVDEGNNWINLRWGPLAVTHPSPGATLGNYGHWRAGSPAIDAADSTYAPPRITSEIASAGHRTGYRCGRICESRCGGSRSGSFVPGLRNGDHQPHQSNQFVTLSSSGCATLNVTSIAATAPFARATGFGFSQNCPSRGDV